MLCFIHEKVSHDRLITKCWTPQSNHRDTIYLVFFEIVGVYKYDNHHRYDMYLNTNVKMSILVIPICEAMFFNTFYTTTLCTGSQQNILHK